MPPALTDRLRTRADAATETVSDVAPGPLKRLWHWVTGQEFFTTSSSLAFYAMISIPPMALIALWVAGAVVPDSVLQDLGDDVDREAPDQLPVGDTLRDLFDVATRSGPLSVLAAIWPATAYGAALARAFAVVAPESERQIRGWKGRLLSLGILALMPLVVFGALAVLYVVPQLVDAPALLLRVVLAAAAAAAFGIVVAVIYSLFRVRDTSSGTSPTAPRSPPACRCS